MEKKPKILTFRICAEGFEKLKNGIAENRFREDTKHWQSRLLEKTGEPKNFDYIEIINGYSATSPRAKVEFLGTFPAVNADGKVGFEIKLWKILEINL